MGVRGRETTPPLAASADDLCSVGQERSYSLNNLDWLTAAFVAPSGPNPSGRF